MSKNVFVIMPFDQEFKDTYSQIITPIFSERGFSVTRADDSTIGQHSIIKDIIDGLINADLVIAEMTTQNANVLYELGIAHTLNKPSVMITQNLEDVPFDLRTYRVITYSFDFRKVEALKTQLALIADEILAETFTFGNPVKDYGVNINVEITKKDVEIIPQKELSLSIVAEEKGLWDFAIDSETAFTELTTSILRVNDYTVSLSADLAATTIQANSIQSSKQPGQASKIHKLIQNLSVKLVKYASNVKEEAELIEQEWSKATESIVGMFKIASIKDEGDLKAAINLTHVLEQTGDQISVSLQGLTTMRSSLGQISAISRDLNFASKKTEESLEYLSEQMIRIDADSAKLVELINGYIDNYNSYITQL